MLVVTNRNIQPRQLPVPELRAEQRVRRRDAHVHQPRLGKTVANLEARNAQYFDFTGGAKVGNMHQLWGEMNTATAKKFFKTLFEGGRPEDAGGFDYDARVNAWRIRG